MSVMADQSVIARDRLYPSTFSDADAALHDLLLQLEQNEYRFVTFTPSSHRRLLTRKGEARPGSLIDILGWSLPFDPALAPAGIVDALRASGMLDESPPLASSRIRVSSIADRLYLHSAFPTDAADAVFLGPDSYRFADLIAAELTTTPPGAGRLIDIGTGAGVGAVTAARYAPGVRVTMTDVNLSALRLARINAAAAGVPADTVHTAGFSGIASHFALVTMNPPFIVDDGGPLYRDGGGMIGGELSVQLTGEALPKLASGGRLILYTGSAIIDGRDRLRQALTNLADASGCDLRYRELDPDVFGEELDRPAYAGVDRIAIVAGVFTRPA